MALRDIKEYYYKVQAQYLEMKANLADFDEALKAGYITEDQLADVKADIYKVEENYNRLTYILFLLEQPNRKSKVPSFNRRNAKLNQHFQEVNANMDAVLLENKSVLGHLREELKKLTEQK